MTELEFKAAYAQRSGLSVEEASSAYEVALRCRCGEQAEDGVNTHHDKPIPVSVVYLG